MASGKFVSMTTFALLLEVYLPWKFQEFLFSRFLETPERGGGPLKGTPPLSWSKKFFFWFFLFFNVKVYHDPLYVCYKNQNHPKSGSLWKTRFFGDPCMKIFFKILTCIMIYRFTFFVLISVNSFFLAKTLISLN